MASTFVPPGGMAGVQQQTVAAKASMGLLRPVRTASQRKGSKAQKRYRKNKRVIKGTAKNAGSGPAFGSPAWRRKYMKGGKKKKKARRKK